MTVIPAEILDLIVSHYYAPWSLYILDRNIGSLPIDGIPSSTLLRVNHEISSLARHHEQLSFTGHLIFTTPSTQWRILKRLSSMSPTRLAWILEHVRILVFCSPPLFTSRIPWAYLPALQRVELDYCYRSANFRCQGTARELEAGYLDPLIANFARDTERFDLPVVEDAWKAVEGRAIEVLVIKRMNVAEMPSPMFPPASQPLKTRIENWKLKVVARHQGKIQDIRFEMMDGNHELPFEGDVIWTALEGFRSVVSPEKLPKRTLRLKGTEDRRTYLVHD